MEKITKKEFLDTFNEQTNCSPDELENICDLFMEHMLIQFKKNISIQFDNFPKIRVSKKKFNINENSPRGKKKDRVLVRIDIPIEN